MQMDPRLRQVQCLEHPLWSWLSHPERPRPPLPVPLAERTLLDHTTHMSRRGNRSFHPQSSLLRTIP